jgi:hypothetical protein
VSIQVTDEMVEVALDVFINHKTGGLGDEEIPGCMRAALEAAIALPKPFPVKDFEVENTSITKEEARAIVRKVTAADSQRLAQGEDGAWQKIHVLSSVMEFRALTESERRELHECHLTIRETTQPPHHDRGEDALVQVALRNLPQYIGKASFASSVDKQAALNCVEVLAAALTEAKQQGPGEAGSPSLKQTPAWWVGYSIGHTGRAPYHCIGPDKPPSQYANDSVHWTPLYTAPQVEAKRQTGEGES